MDGDNKFLSEDEFVASRSVVKKVETGGESVLMTENIDQAFALAALASPFESSK